MIDNEKAEKVEAFNLERCDPEMLRKRANKWQEPDQPGRETVKMCNSYYGIISVKEEEENVSKCKQSENENIVP